MLDTNHNFALNVKTWELVGMIGNTIIGSSLVERTDEGVRGMMLTILDFFICGNRSWGLPWVRTLLC